MGEKATEDILLAFRENEGRLTTSDVVSHIYPDKYSEIQETLSDSYTTSRETRKAKKRKAKLHRRVLYHLNRLVDEDVLKVTQRSETGEKHYSLNIKGNEELVFGGYKKRKRVLTKSRAPSLPTEGYEDEGILNKYGENWLETVNALILTPEDLDEFFKSITPLYGEINDVIGINQMESYINDSSKEELTSFYSSLKSDNQDFGKRFSLLIDASMLTERGKKRFVNFLEETERTEGINFIFKINTKELQNSFTFFERVIDAFSPRKVYFKNKDLTDAPYVMGRAGPYTADEDEWNDMEDLREAAVLSQSTYMIDIKRYCESFDFSVNGFEDLVKKTLTALFKTNSAQRRRTEDYFPHILSTAGGREAFSLSRNYIRFWNYDFFRLNYDRGFMEGIFRHLEKRCREFCETQEGIYTSCGMPARFRSVFSVASTSLEGEYFETKLDRSRLEVSALKDFYGDDIREHMEAKESLADIYGGGFPLTVHKHGDCQPEEAVRQINIMLNTYKVPFFAYEAGVSGKVKPLHQFR